MVSSSAQPQRPGGAATLVGAPLHRAWWSNVTGMLALTAGLQETRTYYKVVALVGDRMLSIFDGKTRYALEQVTAPPEGCWVCPSLMAVTEHSLKLPSRSKLLDVPRAILRVAGWNANGIAPREPDGHTPSESKLLVSHIMPLEVLPYEALMAASGLQPPPPPLLTTSRPTTPRDVSISGLIAAFEQAFPNLSLQLLRCSGQLAIQCGANSYDPSAWLTFHSCGEPWTPAPVVIRVIRDMSLRTPYTLAAALSDVEACLEWMIRARGPCELVLTEPGGEFWEATEIAYEKTMPSSSGPRCVRDNASPMAALVAPACSAGESSTFRVVEVPCSGTYANYRIAEHFPRLCAMLAPAALRPSSSSSGARPSGRAHAAVQSARTRGMSLGTALAASGQPCAELVAARRSIWAMPSEQMHSVAGVLAMLELQLPRAAKEPERHAAVKQKLAETEQVRRGARSTGRYPSPRSLSEVFSPDRYPPEELPRERQKATDPGAYEAECRAQRAKLFGRSGFRTGVAFETAVVEAKAKQIEHGTAALDALDVAVLNPPIWTSFDGAPAGGGAASPRPRHWR